MAQNTGRPVTPAAQIAAGSDFFAALGLDVTHFPAIWHTFKVGELLATDLNAVAGQHGLSIADFHLLSALMIAAPRALRATDLAHALNVSNAVLSGRIRKLEGKDLLRRTGHSADRRASLVGVTEAGEQKVQAIGVSLEEEGRFVRCFRQLASEDQKALSRIMSELHIRMDRDFRPTHR